MLGGFMDVNMIPVWTREGYGYDDPSTSSVILPDPYSVKPRVLYRIRSDFKICGLYCGSHGRSCEKHGICGHNVVVGNIMRLKYATVPVIYGLLQRRIAAVLLDEEGKDTCTVGFLTPHLYEQDYIHHYVGANIQDEAPNLIELQNTYIQVSCLGAGAQSRRLQDDELLCGFADCVLLATNKDVIPVVYNN
jgi:hypothetical protein